MTVLEVSSVSHLGLLEHKIFSGFFLWYFPQFNFFLCLRLFRLTEHLFLFTKRVCLCVCISSVFLSSFSDVTSVLNSLVSGCGNTSLCRWSSDNFPWLSFLLPLVHCARETCLSNLALREFANFLPLLLVKSTRPLFIFILQLILFSVW